MRSFCAVFSPPMPLVIMEQLFNQLANHALVGIYLIQHEIICYANPRLASMFGYTTDEMIDHLRVTDIFHPDDLPVAQREIQARLNGEKKFSHYEIRGRNKQGGTLHLEVFGSILEYQGAPALLGNILDITQRKETEREWRLLAQVFEHSREAIVITDAHNKILKINPTFTQLTGYIPEEVYGKSPKILNSGKHDQRFYQDMWQRIFEVGHWQGEIWDKRKNGELYPKWLNIHTLKDQTGAISHYIASFSDISERKNREAHIEFLAHHDQLTGLPNRVLLQDRLGQALIQAQRMQQQVALLVIDLDHFKDINDSLGHRVGDEILQVTSTRLYNLIEISHDTLSRVGGDEFVLLLPNTNAPTAARMADKILSVLSAPIQLQNHHELQLTPSIGISLYPDDANNAEDLLKNADIAMYGAKAGGRNNYHFYTQTLQSQLTERISLENALKRALENHELVLNYQPKIDLDSGCILGVEALLRWHHPKWGIISPIRFIPIAEESGLIIPIGLWVVRTACEQYLAWEKQGLQPIPIAVNVSAVQFRDESFIGSISKIIAEYGLHPGALEIEITESILLGDDEERVIDKLKWLEYLGFHLSLDDFGTGYSSLSYLRRFPIGTLKIDQSFVRKMVEDEPTRLIVESICDLGRKLGLRLVAEGVEHDREVELLQQMGCNLAQGYRFSRPLAIKDFLATVHEEAQRWHETVQHLSGKTIPSNNCGCLLPNN